ncbi:MAG: hypothetical protein ACYSWZ_11350 [Planctomycetota bacterium]
MYSKNTKFRFHNILIFILFIFIIGAIAIGETIYEQSTDSSIDDMTSETEATLPADRSRTDIGIGEVVECRVDSNSWEDKDCEKVDDGPWTEVNDTIGDRVWACSGSGEISPTGVTQSDTTTLTADLSPGSCEVEVDVYDSNDQYVDDEINMSITFTIYEPNGMNVSFDSDVSPWTAGNSKIGVKSKFLCTVLPTSVNFYNVDFQEDIPAQGPWTWPDGNDFNKPAETVPWGVRTINGGHNRTWDTVTSTNPLEPIGRLDGNPDPNITDYNDFNDYDRLIPEDYLNESNNWICWLPDESHPREYKGSNQKTRVGIKATNTDWGSWEGPWD